jgi:hypothetical protein
MTIFRKASDKLHQSVNLASLFVVLAPFPSQLEFFLGPSLFAAWPVAPLGL